MPFIRKCATQSNLRVRVLASRALTGVVSNEKLPAVIRGIAEGLPCGSSEMASTESGLSVSSSTDERDGGGTATCCSISFNAIHGILAQLNSLLDSNCRNLNDISKKDLIFGDLIQLLWKCSWIGSFKLCPCPTLISSYLRILDCMFDIARTYKSNNVVRIKTLMLKLSSECLDREKTGGSTFYDPTVVEVHKQAATSFFSCVFGGTQEASEENHLLQKLAPASNLCEIINDDSTVGLQGKLEQEGNLHALQGKIMSCISDSSYEVRLVMLKLLHQFMETTNSNDINISVHLWAKANLQPLLMELLSIEKNPKCIYHILRNIYSWNLLHFVNPKKVHDKDTIHVGTMDCNSVLSFWETLVSLSSFMRHSKTREIVLCCMGLCIRKFRLFGSSICIDQSYVEENSTISSVSSDQWERWGMIYNCIDKFIILLKQHSASSEPVNMRKATAESVVASGLLEEAMPVTSHIHNDQIPSEELPSCKTKNENGSGSIAEMKTINLYGLRVLEVWFTCIQLLEDEDCGLRERLAKNVQSCINSYIPRQNLLEETVPLQVETVIKSSFEFLSSVFGHWMEYINYLLKWVLHIGDYEIAHGNLVRRVFDKEIDNHHEEKMLLCQICCSHLERLLCSPSWVVPLGSQDQLQFKFIRFLGSWRSRFLHKLLIFASDYIKDQGRTDWVGGIGNHKDAFLPVYANLLGLYSLLQFPQEGFHLPVEITEENKLLSPDFVHLSKIIRPFLTNPFISNLYFLVTLSNERMLGISPTHTEQKPREVSVSEDFDPFFLLK
uniref:Thyroid adenoma-associated n=2 Tax=Anthurium amnicola TaxID=1678845 RepID=A0A1D1Z9G8_9ARAE